MLKSMRKNGLTLALFALGCTAMVVLTNELTRDRIAHQQELEKLRTLQALLPEGSYDNDLVASCKLVSSREYLGSDEPMPLYTATLKGVHTGYALETVAPDGYSGAIRMVVGTDAKGAVSAVRVLAHKETPGLGDKIEHRHAPHGRHRRHLGGEEGGRRIRPLHRGHHHPAGRGQGGEKFAEAATGAPRTAARCPLLPYQPLTPEHTLWNKST